MVVVMSIWTPDCLLSILWWIKYSNGGFVIAKNQTFCRVKQTKRHRAILWMAYSLFLFFSLSNLFNLRFLWFFWYFIHFLFKHNANNDFHLFRLLCPFYFVIDLKVLGVWQVRVSCFGMKYCWIYFGKWQEFHGKYSNQK